MNPTQRRPTTPQTVLVTGGSSGIGRAVAEAAAREGHRVYGTARRPESAEPLDGVTFVALDVQDSLSVDRCVKSILEREGRIDSLVNNAGVTLHGAIEECSIDEARTLFETNFFGMVRMIQAVLPGMRERKAGQIVNIGSIAGFLPVPFEGMYVASKHAVKGLTETLRYELAPFGIRVALIEPGFMKTALDRNTALPAALIRAYDGPREAAVDTMNRSIQSGAGPEVVAAVVMRALADRSGKWRHLAGQDALQMKILRAILPSSWFEAGVRRKFGQPPRAR